MNTDNDYSGDPSIFRNDPPLPAFSTSATATKKPKPGTPSFISRIFGNKPAKAVTDIDVVAEELAAERERVRLVVEELKHRTGDRDRAKATLEKADALLESLKAERATQAEYARECWGRDISFPIYSAYVPILAMDSALVDFQKAREPLVKVLKEAESALRAFQRENDLEDTD